jgi:hypothetical protein
MVSSSEGVCVHTHADFERRRVRQGLEKGEGPISDSSFRK